MKRLTSLLAGVTLAMGLGPANGALQAYEDDDLDFHFRLVDGVLTPVVAVPGPTSLLNGDVLIASLEFLTSSIPGLITDTQELTGISVIQAVVANGNVSFQPYSGGYNAAVNAILGANTINVAGGGAGGGAMIAMWLDNSPNLDIGSELIVTDDGFSCGTIFDCLTQASDGTLYQVDGFVDGDNNYWNATALAPPSTILQRPGSTTQGLFNSGLSVLDAGISGATNAPVQDGDLGPVAVLLSGTLGGGGYTTFMNIAQRDSLVADGYVATSDFQMTKDLAEVPTPGVLALLGAGLLGFRLTGRRRHV